MELYLLLISHITILFPIYVIIKTFYDFRLFETLIVLFNIIFTGISSIIYHSYSYENINKNNDNYREWAILDYYFSRVVIITTVMYIMNIRQPYIYIYSQLISIFFLISVLFINQEITSYIGIITSLLITIIKYDFLKKLFFFQKKKFIITILFLILSTFFFYYAYNKNYEIFHSLWHFFINLSAGVACHVKYLYYKDFYNDYNRASTSSI